MVKVEELSAHERSMLIVSPTDKAPIVQVSAGKLGVNTPKSWLQKEKAIANEQNNKKENDQDFFIDNY